MCLSDLVRTQLTSFALDSIGCLMLEGSADTAPKSWETHPVTKGVGNNTCIDVPSPKENKCDEKAKERGVCELKDAADESWDNDAWGHKSGRII